MILRSLLRHTLSCVILCCALCLHAATYTPSEVPNPKTKGQACYVANPDSLLADSTVFWLNQCAALLEEQTNVEMAIVALASTDNADAFDFSYELFQRWGIGHKGQNTGVLILFVLDSHDLRIMTGTGIEGILTDAKCSQIMHDEMFPAFREEDYDAGLCRGALAIYETCTDGEVPEELLSMKSLTNRGKYGTEEELFEDGGRTFMWTVGISILVCVVLIYFLSFRKCPKCHKRKAKAIRRQTLVAATYAHAGKEEVTYRCKDCGHEFIVISTLPRLTRSSYYSHRGGGGGGFSGGSWGGGSTSGGGAGGRW